MGGFVDGHNWVYTIHIILIAPLLIYISTGYLFDNKLNDDLYRFAMWLLLTFAVLMVGYHFNELRMHSIDAINDLSQKNDTAKKIEQSISDFMKKSSANQKITELAYLNMRINNT